MLLAALVALPMGVSPMMLLIAAWIVIAHVAATRIGIRLRQHADEVQKWDTLQVGPSRAAADAAEHSCDLSAAALPPPSPWHRRGSTSLGWLPTLVIAGAILGGCLGGALFLTDMIGHRASPAGVVVGAMSLAVVGGWLAFIGGSFYAIFRHGLRDAMAQQNNDELRHTIDADDAICRVSRAISSPYAIRVLKPSQFGGS